MRNRITKCVEGFTVLEAIVAMVLTGIVVSIAVVAILFYTHFFKRAAHLSEVQRSVHLFQLVLAEDVQCAEILYWDSELICQKQEYVVSYEFHESFILRSTEELVDTFRLAHEMPELKFCTGKDGLVEYVRVVCSYDGLAIPVSASKAHSVGILIK